MKHSKIIEFLEGMDPKSRLVDHSQVFLNFTCGNPEYVLYQPPIVWNGDKGIGANNIECRLQIDDFSIGFENTVTETVAIIKMRS